MNDDFMDFYDKELAFIQKSASDYARSHPKVGGRLQISDNKPEDPFVERLLSGVAMLNAKVQHKLKDDFPELTDALLGTLYPHFQRPIPAMSIVQFEPSDALDAVHCVPAQTLLDTDTFEGESCRFSTSYPVDIQPIKIEAAALMARPFVAPGANENQGASAVLRICLKTLSEELSFAELNPENLRLHLKGQAQHTYALHEQLLNNTVNVVLARSENDPHPINCGVDIIQAVGFDIDEGLLPYPANAFMGYRLLTEYFVFPQKFMFVDIKLKNKIPADAFGELNLYIYLNQTNTDLEHFVNASSFALGCTPVINLFPHTADPIRLDHTHYDYQIVPDGRRSEALEIYSIDTVKGSDSQGKQYEYTPFYGIQHQHTMNNHGTFWFSKRRNVVEGEHQNEQASECDISLIDLNFDPYQPHDESLDIKLSCLNRNLPSRLPSGTNQPKLFLVEGDAPVSSIHCLTAPGQTIRPPLQNRAHWKLLSHLNLNHLSLSSDQSGEALKEILRLYDFKNSESTRSVIESIQKVSISPITAPITIAQGTAMCRGSQIEIVFDPRLLSGGSAFLLASVLERFLALYSSINSFTRLVARIKNQEGDLKRWPPRAGERALL